jgi:hypothetical protein
MDPFRTFRERLAHFNAQDFEKLCAAIYLFQAKNNPVFREYHQYLGRDPQEAVESGNYCFLPIEFFKSHAVVTGNREPEIIFRSSGTTGTERSEHRIMDLDFYKTQSRKNFELFYGPVHDYHILALLPSYLERKDASLVAMADHLIRESNSDYSGFYLDDLDKLLEDMEAIKRAGDRKILLLGVSFALLDLGEYRSADLSGHIVMETGGMKGRREELTREQLHDQLKKMFNVPAIHSEYGMTELLSQAYSGGNGKFFLPPWMKMEIRDVNDPFSGVESGRTGGINIIDLANFQSCSFIETKDLGRIDTDGKLEVIGRYENSDIRGCNLRVN